MLKKIPVPTLLCEAALMFSACEKKGPMERSGEKVDETVRTIQNGGEKTAGDKVSDAADNVRKNVEKATDEVKK
jgi:hypothetical protein